MIKMFMHISAMGSLVPETARGPGNEAKLWVKRTAGLSLVPRPHSDFWMGPGNEATAGAHDILLFQPSLKPSRSLPTSIHTRPPPKL